jgi:hypothetical protein
MNKASFCGILFFAALFLCPLYETEARGSSNAAAFLEIDSGARAAGMGGAFTAVADDASSIFYNPAGPALARDREIMLSHSQWLEGLWHDQAAYLQPVSDKLSIFTGAAALSGTPLEKYDIAGNRTGRFTAFDGAFGVGTAMVFGGGFYGGVNFKAVCQRVDNIKAFAYAGDLGFLKNYKTLRLGAVVQNAGTQMKLDREGFDLPLTYRGGAAFRALGKFWLSGEVIKIEKAAAVFAAGAEGELNLTRSEAGYLRIGYKGGRSENTGSGISCGAGFKSGPLYADYAFSPFGGLGDTHRVTLGFKFGGKGREVNPENNKRPEPDENKPVPQEAEDLYQEYMRSADSYAARQDYINAAKEYDLAQKSLSGDDPRNIFALERQGHTFLKMNNIPGAKKLYLAAIQLAKKLNLSDEGVVDAYIGLAYCFEKSGDLALAARNYEKALQLSTSTKTRSRITESLKRIR